MSLWVPIHGNFQFEKDNRNEIKMNMHAWVSFVGRVDNYWLESVYMKRVSPPPFWLWTHCVYTDALVNCQIATYEIVNRRNRERQWKETQNESQEKWNGTTVREQASKRKMQAGREIEWEWGEKSVPLNSLDHGACARTISLAVSDSHKIQCQWKHWTQC